MAAHSITIIESFKVAEGQTYKETRNISGEDLRALKPTLPAAVAGTLTTRTDDDEGAVTAAAHGILATNRVDLYWATGARRGMVAGVIAGNVVPVTGGSGDVLPAAATALTITKSTEKALAFSGNAMQALVVYMPKRGTIVFVSGTDTEEFAQTLEDMGVYTWHVDSGLPNPLAGDTITKIFISQSFAAAQNAYVGVLLE